MSTFSEHLKFLVEGKLNEAPPDQAFSQEVKDFFLNKFEFTKLTKMGMSEVIIVELDKFPKVGEYQARVYPEGKNKISYTLSFIPKGSTNIVTLMESPIISTSTNDYQKIASKIFKNASTIVEKISDFGI